MKWNGNESRRPNNPIGTKSVVNLQRLLLFAHAVLSIIKAGNPMTFCCHCGSDSRTLAFLQQPRCTSRGQSHSVHPKSVTERRRFSSTQSSRCPIACSTSAEASLCRERYVP